MDMLGKIFGGLWELLISLVVGLFNVIWSLVVSLLGELFRGLGPLLIIIIVVIVIAVAIYVGKKMNQTNKEKHEEQNYIGAMKAKYANRSKNELAEIYDYLINLENCRKNAEKKDVYAKNREEQEAALISNIAVTMLEEELGEKYPFISVNYLHHDIAYLKNLI